MPLPVTKDLGEKMNKLFGIQKAFKVIPNVVDTTLFYPSFENKNGKKRFIHVSTLGYHKNIWGILNTTKKLYQTRQDFELYLAGKPSEEIVQLDKRKWFIQHLYIFYRVDLLWGSGRIFRNGGCIGNV